jgi:hypothetical protein
MDSDLNLTRKQREEKNKHKYVPEHLQEVRDDETGKKILRGAFQGGAIWTVGY